MNMGTYRRARAAYFNLSPRERAGMTPERLAQIMQTPAPEVRING